MSSQFEIKVKTSSEGTALRDAKKELSEVKNEGKETARTLKEAQHAAKLFGDEAAGAAKEARGLFKEAGAASGLIRNLGSQIGSLLSGAAFGTALTVLGTLIQKAVVQIRQIVDLIAPAERKLAEANDTIGETKTASEQAAEALEKLSQAFEKAVNKAGELRKKEDELSDAKLANELARVDAQEALGPEHGGISHVDARLRRTQLRLNASREKTDRDAAAVEEQENAVKAMQAFANLQFNQADFAQQQKERRRESLLTRASQVLQIDKEKLRDPETFEREYNRALGRTQRYQAGVFTISPIPQDEADRARAAEIKALSPLLPLLQSPTRRIDRARERLATANTFAGEAIPELERQKEIVNLRGSTATNTAAADVFGLAGEMDKNNQLLGQVGEALGTRLRDQNEAIRAIMQKLNITDQDLNLLKQQIRLRPSGQ